MCQAEAYLTAEEKATLLNEHNLLRSQVNPPAANMEEMVSHMYWLKYILAENNYSKCKPKVSI